jgi:thioredoxin reductase
MGYDVQSVRPCLVGIDAEMISESLMELDVDVQSKIYASWTIGLERANLAADLRHRMLRHRQQLSGKISSVSVQTQLSGPSSFGDSTTDELADALIELRDMMSGLQESVGSIEDDMGNTTGMLGEVQGAAKDIKDKTMDVVRTAKAAELQGMRTEKRLSTQSQRASLRLTGDFANIGRGSVVGQITDPTSPTLPPPELYSDGGMKYYEYDYIVIGGGVCAGYLANEMVALGLNQASVLILSAEQVAPYERTTLSKSYLNPPGCEYRAKLPDFYTTTKLNSEPHDPDWYAQNGIQLVLGEKDGRVAEVDLQEFIVVTEKNVTYKYRKNLFVATGMRPLKAADLQISGHHLQSIFSIRDEAYAAQLVYACEQFENPSEKNLVVVGAGYLGVEIAAAMSEWGFNVSLCFPDARPLSQILTEEMSYILENCLLERGINCMHSHFVRGFESNGQAVEQVVLQGPGGVDDIQRIPADVVVVCGGSRINSEILSGWCEMVRGGIRVDANFRLEAYPDVFVLGDLASFPSPFQRGKFIRLEHVDNARRSAQHAAQVALLGDPHITTYECTPFFFSHLFGNSEKPMAWEFHGDDNAPDIVHFAYGGRDGIGGFFVSNGHVVGGILLRTPPPLPEDSLKLRMIVAKRPPVENSDRLIEYGLTAFDNFLESEDWACSPRARDVS